MGLWAQVRELFRLPSLPPGYAQFDADDETPPRPVDRVIGEMMGGGIAPKVSRQSALSVPAVLRGRNLICSISTLPLVQYARNWQVEPLPLLEQIDPDVPNVVTLAQTIEDLLFEGISWWRITETTDGTDKGFPTAARHLDVTSVSLNPPSNRQPPAPLPSGEEPRGAVVYVAGEEVSASKIIRFDSPNPGLLKTAGRAIRRAILLDQAAALYADDPRPLDYFTPTLDADPVTDDEVEDMIRKWITARKARATGYVPAALKYNTVDQPTPADLQLVELQKRAALDIANALGLDPEDLGISTTSRTYQNDTDRRQDRINDVLSPFMSAITDRLSMRDVTRPGHLVRFDLDDYMRADPLTRWQVYEKAKTMDVITTEEIRDAERKPPLPAGTKRTAKPGNVVALRPAGVTFADDEPAKGMTFATFDFAAAATPPTVDLESRTITGMAVPYNAVARKYGLKFRFLPGSLEYSDVSRIKHLKDHYTPVGVTLSVEETKAGPIVKLSVLGGPEGSATRLERDQLLYDAKEGLYDGLSIGVDFSMDPKAGDVEWNEKDQVYDVKRASWRETSTTPMPAFDDARVTKVAASRSAKESGMPETMTEPTTAPAAPAAAPTQPAATETVAAPPAAQPGVTLSIDQLASFVAATGGTGVALTAEQLFALAARPGGLAALFNPAPPVVERQTVDPTRAVALTASVTEPAPYRFDHKGNIMRGSHDFSSDLIAGLKSGDKAAYDRALSVVSERFDVSRAFDTDRADTGALNPSRQRPDMYVDQRTYRYPVWEAINKGTLTDVTPFVFPKFNSASGLVNNHTEGVEPTPGTFTVTSQTVTPAAVSGKAEITREVWDQGGNPQVSGLIWRQMEKGWYEALEARAVAVLDAATPTAIALTAGVKDDVLDDELTAALVLLQFVRGGFSMDNLFTQVDLYKALAAAEDSTGRKLYPALGPANASGAARARWSALDINGIAALPAWALAASGAVVASSYLFDSESVHGWASAPNRLDFEYQVKSVEIAIWGYGATAISDLAGVREITYDPVAP
ncbi:phage portal protein [Micromonospora tarensis]|uniref:Phage portal protein n=1 Tax=Micromonospora tarensis TaxID=2806100 RepID=A0ABS1Y9R2_9ACTN|nr:phage portal protein [Micromonospora tarensis]MBM0274129.1 phage portal protein [Micromonospora tarensis]